jgi:hypothetical protein
MEFTEEEKQAYQERLKMRAAYKAQQEAETKAAKAEPKSKEVFKSKIGKGFANVLSKTADKAEGARAKYDYVKGQTGRITSAITPAKKPAKGKMPPQLKQYAYKHHRAKARTAVRYKQPVYRQLPRSDAFTDLIHGPPTRPSYGGGNDMFDEMVHGSSKRSKKKGDDFFKGLI